MQEIKLNPNLSKVKESATLKINQQAKKLREEGRVVYHWGFGESPFPVPQEIQNELKKRTSHKEYVTTAGLPLLRETIADYYQSKYQITSINKENTFIGPGSKELLFQLLYILEGDFIIPTPSWVSYLPQLQLKNANVHIAHTSRENGYRLTADILEETCQQSNSDQRILILNSPSNPTGQVYSQEDLEKLVPILEKYNVIVISDEIYSQVDFTHEHSPSLASLYTKTVITGGLSKSYSAGGYRLGYMILASEMENVGKALKSFISETFSAVSAPIQYCAVKAWDLSEKNVFKRVALYTQIHSIIGRYFALRFQKMNIHTTPAQGAFYLFIDFENYRDQLKNLNIQTSSDLSNYLINELGIAILPGCDFYREYNELSARVAFVDYDGKAILEKLKENKLDQSLILQTYPQLKNGLDKLESFLKQL
ncbi:pyridoxal phosphate-dependent aminotransferase [Bacteriovoracaceae bacterium]|nr:pyridoxal phosphate-dependent aminotransferase [Bacteriovoracaceae bacterium]